MSNFCKQCKNPIAADKKQNIFCSRSCSVSFNNKGRILGIDSKLKQSIASKSHYEKFGIPNAWHAPKEHLIECKVCGKSYNVVGYKKKNRVTCSETCRIHACVYSRTYPNGKNNKIKWLCKTSNTTVTLESSWEVKIAKFLDENYIKWIRPKHLKWIDTSGKTRHYYSDFYLIDFNLYVDPKNPYCMKLDEYKMNYLISAGHRILYGDVDMILAQLNMLDNEL